MEEHIQKEIKIFKGVKNTYEKKIEDEIGKLEEILKKNVKEWSFEEIKKQVEKIEEIRTNLIIAENHTYILEQMLEGGYTNEYE